MTLKFYSYPPCGTCRKAKKWLQDHEIEFEEIHIVEHPPSRQLLEEMYQNSGLELKKLFNTSGKRYRELNLKEKVKDASEDELLDILSSDGMLMKRPIVTDGKQSTFGFNEENFKQHWLK